MVKFIFVILSLCAALSARANSAEEWARSKTTENLHILEDFAIRNNDASKLTLLKNVALNAYLADEICGIGAVVLVLDPVVKTFTSGAVLIAPYEVGVGGFAYLLKDRPFEFTKTYTYSVYRTTELARALKSNHSLCTLMLKKAQVARDLLKSGPVKDPRTQARKYFLEEEVRDADTDSSEENTQSAR